MIEIKKPNERTNLDLLELVCQLHSRALQYPSREMHDAYWEARRELEARLEQKELQQHGVMQAEGSDGAKGATVGNSAAGQNGSVGLCKHEEVIYYKGYICKQCDLPILC